MSSFFVIIYLNGGIKVRKLIIMRGAMGCGKSTFIKENNLEKYTLCADTIRLMFNAPEMNFNYKEDIPQYNNKKVWDLLFSILEERMKKGEFTIIDAAHAKVSESFPIYKKLAEKYRYRLYVIDFTDIPTQEVYKRNKMREEYKQVDEKVIDRAYKLFAKEKVPSSFKVVKPDDFGEIISNKIVNLDKYENIQIFGDIHACAETLKEYFKKFPFNENSYYIFTGDYFDRGLENYETFKLLTELMNHDNTLFLVGNHEDRLYKYSSDDEVKIDYDLTNTIKEFNGYNVKKSEIRGFVKNLSQIAYFTFHDKTYLVTHGGIPYMPKKSLDFYSTNTFIYGTNKYEDDIDKVYNEFMKSENNKVYQIHGHRNFYKYKFNDFEYSFNLEGDIENGGYLRVLILTNNTYEYREIKNNIYNPNLKEETAVFNLINDLRGNKYVFEKDLGDNLSSFNFSKEAFYNRAWDKETTTARGLFIDTLNHKIVARSYNKFFKVNERIETNLDNLYKTFVYPVNFYLKYNGFLGILSVFNDELFFASKSTNTGEYVKYFKDIFYKLFNEEQIKAMKEKIIKDNVSLVFEVIDHLHDPHIIEYNKDKIILLDIIKNTVEFNKVTYPELKEFTNSINIEVKELVYTAENIDEFNDLCELITSDDYKLNNEYIEGFVIEDSNNLMVKTKTKYYDIWKSLRTKMENAINNNKFNTKSKDELEIKFMAYLKDKYQDQNVDVKEINIITERKEFLLFKNLK